MIIVPERTDVRRSGGCARAGSEFDRLCERGYSGGHAKRWFEFPIPCPLPFVFTLISKDMLRYDSQNVNCIKM